MKRIMIVDDEFLVRMGIKSMLNWEETGYSIVCEAANGQDAIKKIQQYAPQIILTDLVMEPVSGLDLIQYCRGNYPDIKIVVLERTFFSIANCSSFATAPSIRVTVITWLRRRDLNP